MKTACVDCRDLRVRGSEAAGEVSSCPLMPPGLELSALCPCEGAMRRPNHNWVLPHASECSMWPGHGRGLRDVQPGAWRADNRWPQKHGQHRDLRGALTSPSAL